MSRSMVCRRMIRLTFAFALLSLLVACPQEPSGVSDQGSVADSGSTPVDSGVASDSGQQTPADTGLVTDSGSQAPADAGAVDAGAVVVDAGEGCAGDNPAGCQDDEDCPGGQVCDRTPCVPSNCACQDGEWLCTADCGAGICTDPLPGGNCPGNSPQGCLDDAECGDGFLCDRSICAPSSCHCGDDGNWRCTRDCRGGRCSAERAYCDEEAAPSGCSQFGCPPQQTCVLDQGACNPSTCSCRNGNWLCSRDCAGGGTCMP